MPKAKMALAQPAAQPSNVITVAPAVDMTVGLVTLNVFDGTRQPIDPALKLMLTITDGAQHTFPAVFFSGSSVNLKLPFNNNFADNYSIVVFAPGFEQAGFQPVKIAPNAPKVLDLILLPKNSGYNFANAKWADIQANKVQLARVFAASDPDPASAYADLEDKPDILPCLLNITTAMDQIHLRSQTVLSYFKTFDLVSLQPDRIFGYADAALLADVKQAAQQGFFDTEPAIDLTLHPGSTSSFKQKQFGEANVQLTFHEGKRQTIDGIDCIYVEPDIDYYKDPLAHIFLEVLPNALTHTVSSPRVVYVLRWIAGLQAGIPAFDPLYTIQ